MNNNQHFGPEAGKIKIKFNDGTAVVEGFIVESASSRTFMARVEGGDAVEVTLARIDAELALTDAGMGTIEAVDADGAAVNVARFDGDVVTLVDGRLATWQHSAEGTKIPARRSTTVTITTI